MSEQTVELKHDATREDFYAVKDAAEAACDCTEEMKLMFKETGVSCKPCAARHVLNGLATLSETL